jgi:hypothetical protein
MSRARSGDKFTVKFRSLEPTQNRSGSLVMRHVFLAALGGGLLLAAGLAQAQPAHPAMKSHDTEEARRATAALNLLEAQGYCADLQEKSHGAFTSFQPQGRDFTATVRQKGRDYRMVVDPQSGRVTRQE